MSNIELRQRLTVAQTIEDLALQWYYFCERQAQPNETFCGVSCPYFTPQIVRKTDLSNLDAELIDFMQGIDAHYTAKMKHRKA